MDMRGEINLLCVASQFFALVIVTSLVAHPLKYAASGCGSISSLFRVFSILEFDLSGKTGKQTLNPQKVHYLLSSNLKSW